MTHIISENKPPIKVVILGGGFCGARIAKNIERIPGISTVLIDRKPYFEYSPLVYKIPTNCSYVKSVRRPFNKILQNTKIITSEIKKVTPQIIETQEHKCQFDILVIATGIDYPIKLQNMTSVYTVKSSIGALQIASKLSKVEELLIIGGGFVGVEITAELATNARKKQITLVHSKSRLLERLPRKASKYVENYLQSKKVEIVFNERIVGHQKRRYITESGLVINADLSIWSAGNEWNPTFMQQFSPTIFSPRNALKTNQFLQLKKYPTIFVGGDITAVPEEKTAQNAERHADLISKNIKQLIKKKPLISYSIQTIPLVISLGNWNGLLCYSNLVITGCIPALGKRFVDWWTYNHYS